MARARTAEAQPPDDSPDPLRRGEAPVLLPFVGLELEVARGRVMAEQGAPRPADVPLPTDKQYEQAADRVAIEEPAADDGPANAQLPHSRATETSLPSLSISGQMRSSRSAARSSAAAQSSAARARSSSRTQRRAPASRQAPDTLAAIGGDRWHDDSNGRPWRS